jgi:glycosyltransferase involved in cell wall biosynthesis
MQISIVTGTYNRIDSLSRFVESVRDSIGVGLFYEIVIVDGGSKDGTINWCKKQQDVKLIEQGKLLGAVKAFNAGAYAASGDYVLLANDDITFVQFSILAAYSYMQDNPNCGIGAFMQDRNNREMHVEYMPAIVNGKQSSVPYGQVCIVQKWLGDKMGWWGKITHTYGGDNELSCNVLETGYSIDVLKMSCIHDMQIDDGLREANDGYPAQMSRKGKPHPDTQKWLNKWTHKRGRYSGMIGANVKTKTKWDTEIVKIPRIFYAPIFEENHPYQRKTKKTLREALQEVAVVYEHDYMTESVKRLIDSSYTFKPDLFLFQIQRPDTKITKNILNELREDHPNAKFVNWNGDYHPEHLYDPDYMALMEMFDVCGFCTTEIKYVYEDAGINWMYLQAGYEDYPEADYDVEHRFDVVYLANGYSQERITQARLLRSVKNLCIGLYGSWPKNLNPDGITLYDYAKNYLIYRSAKFAVSDQQWPNAAGYVSDRIFHAMRSGVVVLQQGFIGMEELMGLEDRKNCLVWWNLNDLKELLYSVIEPPVELTKMFADIAEAGRQHVIDNFQYVHFVQRMLEVLHDEIK